MIYGQHSIASKVSLIFYQEYGLVQTGKNKSNSELPHQLLVSIVK